MPFVKLDCGILNSTIWWDRDAREVFITALLMAEPMNLPEATAQLEVDSLNETGFQVPPGWYGFVPAAGSGIVRYAGLEEAPGTEALKRLGAPDHTSRTPDFEGRRLVRINGGYLILNYQKYRDKDYSAAERMRLYRQRKKQRYGELMMRDTERETVVTQAEAEAEVEVEPKKERERRFAPPSVEEIRLHAKGLGYDTFDAEGFWAFYESKGWRVGNQPMRSWKAAIVSWRRHDGKMHPSSVSAQSQKGIPPATGNPHGFRLGKDGASIQYRGEWYRLHKDGRRWLTEEAYRPDGTPIMADPRDKALNDEIYAAMSAFIPAEPSRD